MDSRKELEYIKADATLWSVDLEQDGALTECNLDNSMAEQQICKVFVRSNVIHFSEALGAMDGIRLGAS